MGELIDMLDAEGVAGLSDIPTGVSLFKLGLARCVLLPDWQRRWRRVVESLSKSPGNPKPVAVVYADWQTAQSPGPREVLCAAIEIGCPALLIDTANKSAGSLFDHWPTDDVQRFTREVRSHNLAVVLAGSLVGDAIHDAARLMPDLVAVRTAACDAGRRGTVMLERVRGVKQAIAAATQLKSAV
jgi:uncharacterized protein (UPF0264 family)